MGQQEYNACIAAGGSPATCAVYLEEDTASLVDYIGLPFLNPSTGTEGILKKFQVPGGEPAYYLDFPGTAGAGQTGGQRLMPGSLILDPRTRQSLTIGTGGTFTSQTLSEGDMDRMFGASFGGGTSAPQWRPGEQQMEQQALQHQIEQDKADLAWAQKQFGLAQAAEDRRAMEYAQLQIEMLEKRLDNDNRQLMFSTTMAERGTRIQEKGAMQRKLLDLGPDPFRQMAGLGGQAQRGTTPQQTAIGQAQAFINQPLPQPTMNMSLPQLQAMLGGLQGMQPPQMGGFGMAPGAFGMAQGGTIEMEKGSDDVFSMRPKASWLIGEGKHGEGLAAGTAEVLTVEKGPFGIKSVEVTPLAGMAQGGMQMSGLQALAPMYQDWAGIPTGGYGSRGGPTAKPRLVQFGPGPGAVFLVDPLNGQLRGIPNPDIFNRSGFDWGDIEILPVEARGGFEIGANIREPWGLRPELLSQLGVTPELMRFGGEAAVYRRDPLTGELRNIPSSDIFTQSGFRWQDVVNMAGGTQGAYSFGEPHTGPLSITPPTSMPAYQGMGMPLMQATTGALLPPPFKIARELGELYRNLGSDLFGSTVGSAYGNVLDPITGLPTGGMGMGSILAQMQAATPQGRFDRPQRIGFMGTNL